MTQPSKHSKALLYGVAATGILMQGFAIVLMIGWDVSVALVAPLMIVGMFMAFAPALSGKAPPNK